ncbi:MAG: hypothetical protein KBE22_03445 [Candidatus Accumulibacter sp.]|jgi:hypothetical protein|nr:hypothetical protein [Accumulibacter sp.]
MPDPAAIEARQISASDMQELFDIGSASGEAPAVLPNTTQQLIERAAVLGAFTPTELVAGFERGGETEVALDEVLRESVVLTQDGARRWLLGPGSRLAALERLGTGAASLLNEVGNDNPDPLGKAVAALIREQVPDAAQLSTETLRALIAAAQWLRDWSKLAAGLLPQWRAQLKRRELLEPLAQIARGFVGREKDIAKLRDFVDVLPPENRFDGWSRWLHNLVLGQKEPLVVHGIGGIGKSTLMAQFILTHAAVTNERGFPFAYIDFDRLRLDPNNPITLLTEVLEQVGAQFAAIGSRAEEFSMQFREDMERGRTEQRTRSSAVEFARPVADHGGIERTTSQFASWIHGANLGDRPFLLVLDTFEEVQVRGEEAVDAVFRWLEAMFQLPQLRVVISGRAPVKDRKVARHVALGNFDKPAALAFLGHADLSSAVAEEIFDKVGGNPLALRLCILLAQQHVLNTVNRKDLEGWLGKKDGAYIQGYLYTRLLRHVGDERVEKLAHPGLVLRRITPDIILNVLGPAVGLPVAGKAAARDLYEALRKEVSLVSEEGDALIHRKDVRSVMLDMQRADDPTSFADLNRRVIEYYARHDPESDVSRREGAYHRLILQEEDPFQVVAHMQRQDLLSLGTSLDELPERARAAVRALLGRGLTQSETRMLPDEAWAAYAYRRSMTLVAAGSPTEALAILNNRWHVSRAGVLRYPLALAQFNSLLWPEALRSLDGQIGSGLEQPFFGFTEQEKTELRIRPRLEGAFLSWYQGQSEHAVGWFADAEDRARSEQATFLRLEARLGRLLAEDSVSVSSLDRGIQGVLDEIDPRGWKQNLFTLRRVVFLGFAPPQLMREAVSQLGLQLRSGRSLESFLSLFGSRLSAELLGTLQGALLVPTGTAAVQAATMEKLAAAEISKVLAEEPRLDVVYFLRGRFAPWKIPARSALLACYPRREQLEQALLASSKGWPLPETALGARTHRALAEAVVEHAYQSDEFVPTVRRLVQQAPHPASGTELLLDALDLYSRQLSRYEQPNA